MHELENTSKGDRARLKFACGLTRGCLASQIRDVATLTRIRGRGHHGQGGHGASCAGRLGAVRAHACEALAAQACSVTGCARRAPALRARGSETTAR